MKLYYVAVLALLSFNATAGDMEEKSTQFCEKIRSCTLAEMASQDIPPEMEAMLKPLIDGMCTKMMAEMKADETPKALEDDAMACMDSMNALSCSALMNGEAETKACSGFQKKAEQHEK